jgi:uncharacterized protein YbcI
MHSSALSLSSDLIRDTAVAHIDSPIEELPVAAALEATAVANGVRAACKRMWGRGPRDVQVLLADPDTVVVLLSGTLTNAERTLLGGERDSTVMSQRAALHEALEPEVRALVEVNLGRQTHAFMSGVDLQRDVTSFVVTMA